MSEEKEKMEVEKKGEEARVVNWEKFLRGMRVRVLLVEADDSTRKIVAALLRKCSYKVSSASDGLEAWKTLKESPNNIDLVLTEVELPNVSGYALLSMMMEHDSCKSIPVIMMSSRDSMKMVFECMLKGAADFLVKPIRKNELRNLWQHVWRRQSANGAENTPPVENETNSEYNSASNHSSYYMDSNHKNKGSEKGNDTQSSCTRPDTDAETSSDLMSDQHGVSDQLERETLGDGDADETKTIEPTDCLDQIQPIHGFKRCRVIQAGQNLNPAVKPQLKAHQTLENFEDDAAEKREREGNKLNHSISSPFSRYSAKSTLSPLPLPTDENPDASTPNPNPASLTTVFYGQPGQQIWSTPPTQSNPETLDCPEQKTQKQIQDDHSSITSENGAPQAKIWLSVEREAALTKFRLKRKDRCFEKKVRYQSRKKLAEQRPRVKGQFVRQVNPGS
uniref:Pseudo-response regulator 95 homologue n=1 Tax=Lemna aequinoctialis TaxID=89585 RepID=Q2PEF5_LEMAE|nr:pseudo-response regulator 95 homologue [Lemna aequinoctialis]